jgi:hypothetical protein
VNERRVRVSSLSFVVAVSTFEQRTARRYNNTHCTYGVKLQHEGSISELHCAKSFFSRAREDRTIFLQTIITPILPARRRPRFYFRECTRNSSCFLLGKMNTTHTTMNCFSIAIIPGWYTRPEATRRHHSSGMMLCGTNPHIYTAKTLRRLYFPDNTIICSFPANKCYHIQENIYIYIDALLPVVASYCVQ